MGGAYSGSDRSSPLTPVLPHPITSGITTLTTIGDGIAIGGTPLFHLNVVTLWGDQSNVVSLLSINVIDDDSQQPDNLLFEANLAERLAAPEPSTLALAALGFAVLVAFSWRRRRMC